MRYDDSRKRAAARDAAPLFEAGKVPPQAVDIEEAVLGACLVDGAALAEVAPLLAPEMFYRRQNAVVYEAIDALGAAHRAIDVYTVVRALMDAGKLEEAGGMQRVTGLTLKVGSGASAKEHARVVVEKYAMRRLVEAGYRIAELGFGGGAAEGGDVADALAQADALVADAAAVLTGRADAPLLSALVPLAAKEVRDGVARVREGKANGIGTGLADLDRATGGWQPGKLYILAARPAMGKTAMMLHFAKAAAKGGAPAAVFSLEMGDVQLAHRAVLSEANVSPDRYRSRYLSNEELEKLGVAEHSASLLPICIDDTADTTMGQIRAKARALHRQGKCGVAFIDYLQLCRGRDMRNRNREQEVAAMSREAKIMAKELGIPVILLSQLSRDIEKRGSKRPLLSDLRESGAIEQDADVVMFIHRPAYYDGDGDAGGGGCGELIIAKNRDGATGTAPFRYGVGMASIFDAPAPGQAPPANAEQWVSYYEPTDREEF